jgi:serine/threonine-protein kinase RsbT
MRQPLPTETARIMTGTVSKTETLPIKDSSDVVFVRQRVRVWATNLKLSLVDQTKIVTAASELGRNTLEHGGGGELEIAEVVDGVRRGIRLSFSDKGPGIADIKQALTDGFTSKQGMGLGLGGSKRLMNEFDIKTVLGEGTTVTVTRWK